MSVRPTIHSIANLEYTLSEMLEISHDAWIKIVEFTQTNTAVTMRVVRENEFKSAFFIKTLTKTNESQSASRLGVREVQFYDFINLFDTDLFTAVPKCFRHHISEDGKRYYLVLEDLSATHQDYRDIDFNDLESWRYALRALAHFHKNLCGKLSPEQINAHTDDENKIERYIGKLEKSYSLFREYAQDRVDDSVLSLLERSIPVIRKIELEKYIRINENKITTILNRDCHLRNFLYPRQMGGSAKIVDWQFWGMGIGTFDLRHLLGSALNGEMRKHQRELVQYYYQYFTEDNPIDYPWEICWEDYRKGIIDNLFMPVWQYAGFGWEYERWENTLHSAVENYYALDCDEIVL